MNERYIRKSNIQEHGVDFANEAWLKRTSVFASGVKGERKKARKRGRVRKMG